MHIASAPVVTELLHRRSQVEDDLPHWRRK